MIHFDKFALLWGEAQKIIAYSYLKVTLCYPNMNYSGLKVTYSQPKVTHSCPKVTYSKLG